MKRGRHDAAARPLELRGQHLHFDPVSGIAGDMTVAALVDAGVPARVVEDAVAAIGVKGLRVRFEARRRGAFLGRGFVVEADGVPTADRGGPGRRALSKRRAVSAQARAHDDDHAHLSGHQHDHAHGHDHDHVPGHDHDHAHVSGHEHDHAHGHDDAHAHGGQGRHEGHAHDHGLSGRNASAPARGAHDHRDYADIRRLLRRAPLDGDARALAEDIFARLAQVEADLHGTAVERVTFHEVGAWDSIADIVGASAAIAWLAPVSIGSGTPVVGTGTVRTAHGPVPVPAPATAALLAGMPMRWEGHGELTTPTGAAILAAVVDAFGPPPPLRLTSVGYGAGARELADRANVLRVLIGAPIGEALEPGTPDVLLLEANIDDMSGQLLAALFEALFAAGALDVWSTPIFMKKGRPAQQVSALAALATAPLVQRAFFLNATTLGVRVRPVQRATLARSWAEVATPHGSVRVKVAGLDGAPIGAEPEFEDCRRRAHEAGVPVRRVWAAALAAATALVVTDVSPAPPAGRPGGERSTRKPARKANRKRGRA